MARCTVPSEAGTNSVMSRRGVARSGGLTRASSPKLRPAGVKADDGALGVGLSVLKAFLAARSGPPPTVGPQRAH